MSALPDSWMNTCLKKNKSFLPNEKSKLTKDFLEMISFIKESLPYGFSKNGSKQVSRVFFEAVSVGVTLALRENANISPKNVNLKTIVQENDFLKIISGKYHTHTPDKICARIDYIKDRLLGDK